MILSYQSVTQYVLIYILNYKQSEVMLKYHWVGLCKEKHSKCQTHDEMMKQKG